MGFLGDVVNGIGNTVTGGALGAVEGKGWDPFGYQEISKGVGSIAGGGKGAAASPTAAGGAFAGYPQTQGPGAYPGWPVPGPGAQPTYDFQGDQSKPGAAENYFSQNQNKFTAPTQTGQYWQQNQQKFGAPGQGDQFWNQAQGMFNTQKPGSNNAQSAYDQFQTSAPANTDPYFQHAMDRSTAELNNAAAARGQFNSTGALQTIGDANANLLGQQAAQNAQYGLQRGQTAGSLAQGADASSRGINQNQLGWMQGLGSLGLGVQNADLQRLMSGGQLAGNADQLGLAQLMSGMNAAGGAQGALAQRGQNYFNNQMGLANAQNGIYSGTYGAMLGNDQKMFDDQQAALLGLPREQLNQSLNGRASTEQGIGNLAGLAGKVGGMFG